MKIALMMLLLPASAFADEKAAKTETKPEAKAGAPKMEAPKPGPEVEALKPLVGMWSCDGKAPESPMGPAHEYKATLNHKLDLGNFWIWQEYKSVKSKDHPAFAAKGWMGWDGANKHYVWAGVDDMGGWISLTSSGWQGEKIEFAGDAMMMTGKTRAKFTATKGKTPNEMSFEMTMQDPKGNWTPPDVQTCKKK
jgi:hypothetical protein